jgi:hypothetical protein
MNCGDMVIDLILWMENIVEKSDRGSLKMLFQPSHGRTKDNQWKCQADPIKMRDGYCRNTR